MIYVTSLDSSKVEALNNIGNDFKMEQSVDGTLSVSFTTVPSEFNPGYDILSSETIVSAYGHDFKVKQFSNTGYTKRVVGMSTFFEHSKTQIKGIFTGSHTLKNHLEFILKTSGWTYTIDDDISNITNFIKDLGDGNIVALLNKILKYHQIEYIILPGNRLHFSKTIGPDLDYQYRYKSNIGDVVLVEDSTNLFTFIRGYGKDGLEVSYQSPNHTIFGHKEHDPVKDERFTDPTTLTNYIKNTIKDVPDLVIESEIPELTERETGERIWLIYSPLGITTQTRILKQTKVLRDGKLVTDSVVFGNTLIKTSNDLLLEQQEQINDNKDYVEEVKENIQEDINIKFTATEERIISQGNTIKSEYTAAITANAQVIRTEMGQRDTNINNTIGAQYTKITSEYTSSINQTAQGIRTDVNAQITQVGNDILNVNAYASRIDQTASQIQQTVSSQQASINSQGSRISSAESVITQQSNLISTKVSATDFTGAAITTRINQDPWAVSIQASKINFQGHVFGQGSTWSGAVSTSNDVNVGRNINMQGWGGGEIRFPGTDAVIYSNGSGYAGIRANNGIFLNAPVIDFGGVVTGLNNVNAATVGGISFTPITGGLTVRQNGSYLGQLKYT